MSGQKSVITDRPPVRVTSTRSSLLFYSIPAPLDVITYRTGTAPHCRPLPVSAIVLDLIVFRIYLLLCLGVSSVRARAYGPLSAFL